ncbi:hypothetical protein BJ742DRAFT_830653 [Cladochytrium replicatum]|nr:hypothetical protein BJ742DRAFT_830653 [Cladochytrium replicatum]
MVVSRRPKYFAFRPNRTLLRPSFEGYKLSSSSGVQLLSSVPFTRADEAQITDASLPHSLPSAPLGGGYRRIEARTRINRFAETEDGSNLWFVDGNNQVFRCYLDTTDHLRAEGVYDLGLTDDSSDGTCWPPSLRAVKGTPLIVAHDGRGRVSILDGTTGSQFTVIQTNRPGVIIAASSFQNNKVRFLVYTADDRTIERKRRHAGLGSISKTPATEKHIEAIFVSELWEAESGSGGATMLAKVESASAPIAGFIGSETSGFGIVSNTKVEVVMTGGERMEVEEKTVARKAGRFGYAWCQTEEDVIVYVRMPVQIAKKYVQCKIADEGVTVKLLAGWDGGSEDAYLFGGPRKVGGRVDADTSVWMLEDGGSTLTLHIMKASAFGGARWYRLFEPSGDTKEVLEETMDPSEARTAAEYMEKFTAEEDEDPETSALAAGRVAMGGDPVEEEDLEGANVGVYIFSNDAGSRWWLSDVATGDEWLGEVWPNGVDMIRVATRQDVDGLVFAVGLGEAVEHVATVPALGYVAASKREKRFVRIVENEGRDVVGVVVEARRHVYVYDPTGGGMHGKQGVVDLGDLVEKKGEEWGDVVGIGMVKAVSGPVRLAVLLEHGICLMGLE